MTTKAKTGYQSTLRPLLPLEYCTVERASRLLECEVEDLLHWAKLGFIHLYINFDRSFPYYCPRVKLRNNVHSLDLIHAGFGLDLMLSLEPIPAPKDDLDKKKKPIKPTLRTLPTPFPTEPSPWHLQGLWGIIGNDASRYIKQYLSGITGEPHSYGGIGKESAMGYSAISFFAEQKRLSGVVSYDAFATVKLKDGLTPPAQTFGKGHFARSGPFYLHPVSTPYRTIEPLLTVHSANSLRCETNFPEFSGSSTAVYTAFCRVFALHPARQTRNRTELGPAAYCVSCAWAQTQSIKAWILGH